MKQAIIVIAIIAALSLMSFKSSTPTGSQVGAGAMGDAEERALKSAFDADNNTLRTWAKRVADVMPKSPVNVRDKFYATIIAALDKNFTYAKYREGWMNHRTPGVMPSPQFDPNVNPFKTVPNGSGGLSIGGVIGSLTSMATNPAGFGADIISKVVGGLTN